MSGDPNGKDFRPNIDSPEGIAALQMLIDVLPYAPKNVTQYGSRKMSTPSQPAGSRK